MPASDSDANAFIHRLVARPNGSPSSSPGTWDQSKRDARFTRIIDSLVGHTSRKPVAGSRVWTPSLANDSVSRGAGSAVSEPVIDEPTSACARYGLFSPSAPTYIRPATMPSKPDLVPPKVQEQRDAAMRARFGLFEPVIESRK